ncbi:MAG: cytochrome c biogenesis protein CcsA [Gammaproteobacteria bacterium]|nr:cytochrome c biogenesis protein CcsA [Gammaproteobacteria bacterium]
MFNQTILTVISVALYIGSMILIKRTSSLQTFPVVDYQPRQYLIPACLALIIQGLTLSRFIFTGSGIDFGFYLTVSMVLSVVVAVLILSAFTKPVDKICLLIFPLAALSLILVVMIPDQSHIVKNFPLGMQIHILTSILAFSILSIGAAQAVLVALQEHQLRRHQPNRFMRSLPPLQVMEQFLFEILGAGFLLLTISLMTGLVFVHDLFVQHLVHKTVLSISAWLIFGLLLFGKLFYGWRGRIAIRWTLTGFTVLLLAYFGSKMVLELILDRV